MDGEPGRLWRTMQALRLFELSDFVCHFKNYCHWLLRCRKHELRPDKVSSALKLLAD